MLHTLSMEQALSIWSELEQAYYGDNSYGHDTAEIYIHRLLTGAPRNPDHMDLTGIVGEMTRESYDNANCALHDLLQMFKVSRSKVKVEIEGRELGEWLKTARFCHRVHVKVSSEQRAL